jgi:hypothetical protein
LQCQNTRQQGQHSRHHQRFCARNLPAGQRTIDGARDVLIKFSVGIVIHRAACRAHQYRACDENQQLFQWRHAICRQPQAPQCRPQQQQNADGLIESNQANV